MKIAGVTLSKRKGYRVKGIGADVRPVRCVHGCVLVVRRGSRMYAILTWVSPRDMVEVK